jgi:PAS domain S-box-containing protein
VQRVVERTEQLSAINEELIKEINEREHAEESLRRSEAYLAEGQKLSHTGSWAWNVSTGDLYWSDEHYRICGLDPEKERPVYPTMQWIHPEDRAFVQETFEQSIRERSGFELDCRIVWTDGTIRYVHSLAHPAFNKAGDLTEYVGTIIDTTERRQAEELLRKANERVEMVLESITDNFFAVDNEWRYTHFNKHAEEQLKALGMNPASLIGQVLWDVFPNATSGEKLRRSMTERAVHIDEQYTPALGEWYENRIYPSPDGGLSIFQRYVTERKRAEEELQKAQSELAHVIRVTTLGELTASIAHEVNQPLGAIATNGYACLRLLSRDAPDLDGAREAAEAMINDAMRASGVIKRIRALLKKAAPEKALLDINEIIREVISLASSELIKNQVALRTELVTGLPQVEGDRVQLQQVVLNLILNGNEAISGAGWQPRELLISSEVSKPGEVIVRVRDTGTGLDPQDGERIFEPFFTTKESGKGTGLGLSTVYGIVKQSGGNICVYSEVEHGATFKVYLPRVDEQVEECQPGTAQREAPEGWETILLVEDEQMVSDLAARLLRAQGYNVLEARNGEEALSIAADHVGEEIHLLLTDMIMPRMNGRELAERLTRLHRRTRVLFMSGYTNRGIVHHGMLDEGTVLLQKPFTLEGLARKVREVLDAPTQEEVVRAQGLNVYKTVGLQTQSR